MMGVEAPGRQGAKYDRYIDIPIICSGSQAECIGVQNGKLFLWK
jgi:hypothetical protein